MSQEKIVKTIDPNIIVPVWNLIIVYSANLKGFYNPKVQFDANDFAKYLPAW